MKHEIVYYTCNYCDKNLTEEGLINEDGDNGILDSCYEDADDIDICDSIKCYQKHLEAVKEQMMENDGLFYYPLDILVDEVGLDYETESHKNEYKIKWNSEDKWHKYKRETLVNLLIPYYEKYCISGNERYINQ